MATEGAAVDAAFEDSFGLIRPSALQLAIAMAMVKTKPANVSVRDFLDSLRRSHSASVKVCPDSVTRLETSFQPAEYWRERCRQLAERESYLNDQVSRLQKELEATATTAATTTVPLSDLTRPKGKRAIQNDTSSSTARRPASKPEQWIDSLKALEADVGSLAPFGIDSKSPCDSLLNNCYDLLRLLRAQHVNLDADLAHSIRQLTERCDAIVSTLLEDEIPGRLTKAQLKPIAKNLSAGMKSVNTSIGLLFHALHAPRVANLSQPSQGQVIQATFLLFRKLCGHLEAAACKATQLSEPGARNSRNAAPRELAELRLQILGCLAHHFISYIDGDDGDASRTTVSNTNPLMFALAEGVTAHLLSVCATILNELTFDPCQQEDPPRADSARRLWRRAERFSPLLSRAVVVWKKLNADHEEVQGSFAERNAANAVSVARDRLQVTLIRYMFDPENPCKLEAMPLDIPDLTFDSHTSRGRRSTNGPNHDVEEDRKEQVADSFVRELWNLVGWESLMHSLDV